jgi:hypothetical protein
VLKYEWDQTAKPKKLVLLSYPILIHTSAGGLGNHHKLNNELLQAKLETRILKNLSMQPSEPLYGGH